MAGALRWTAERAEVAEAAGRQPGAESSIGYVGGVRLLRLIRDLAVEMAGPAGLLTGPVAPIGGGYLDDGADSSLPRHPGR